MERYPKGAQPSAADMSRYIDNPMWEALNGFLRDAYDTEPEYAFSDCSAQPGWNVKYKKAGRALCTLYPMPGYFIALVVIGTKEEGEADLVMPTLAPYTQALYARTRSTAMGRWLMIEVTSEPILRDVEALIQLRRKIKAKAGR